MRKLRTAAATLAGVALLSGCGGSSTVSASSYVKSLCTAYQGFRQSYQTAGNQYRASVRGATSVAAVKSQLQAFAGAMVAAAGRMITQVKAAGAPDVSGGGQAASQFVSAVTGIKT